VASYFNFRFNSIHGVVIKFEILKKKFLTQKSKIMELFAQLKTKYIFVILLTTFACSDKGDDDPDEINSSGESYINYSVTGSAVNGNFSISTSLDSDQTHIAIVGVIDNEDTSEGVVEVARLTFSSWTGQFGDNYLEVFMALPTHTGPLALGEIETGSTGVTTYSPTFNMSLRFDEVAFYDSDDDGDNDLLTHLLSKNVSATITEIEKTTNSFGILTVAHVKGSFEGQAYFKAYAGPSSDPQVLLHTVSGEFEYNIPIE
jgi:hypothetical protein